MVGVTWATYEGRAGNLEEEEVEEEEEEEEQRSRAVRMRGLRGEEVMEAEGGEEEEERGRARVVEWREGPGGPVLGGGGEVPDWTSERDARRWRA